LPLSFHRGSLRFSLMLLSPVRGRGWVRGLHAPFDAPSPSLSP
jgi:hypothetical protein